ncbi:hypothetical protein JT328_gp41 [Aeromonas phage BUCT551]|uniref:Uncharacterized protein n=1 Tax=Aeromonas phage BUCT551 TaxID=2776735 RepID=A0A7L8ZK08_9CAUD|nr:hypothetical protein JT328_gp41 [Aeromonas phage BUCT551]QOI69657.1 hypothetical protein [Aeromonas phage BUCT551]UIS24844.1 hypothetical protein pAEv1812_35 [Aeromonas phage pAEv1812]
MPSGKGPGLRKAVPPTTTDTDKNKKKDKQRKDKKVSPDSKG